MKKIIFLLVLNLHILSSDIRFREATRLEIFKDKASYGLCQAVLVGALGAIAYPILKQAIQNGWGVEIIIDGAQGKGIVFNNSGRFGIIPKNLI